METTGSLSPESEDFLNRNADLPPTEEELAAFVSQKETEENMEKLARKLSADWTGDIESAPEPDLSYARFEEKLKKAKGQ